VANVEEESHMKKRILVLAGAAALTVAVLGGGVAVASGGGGGGGGEAGSHDYTHAQADAATAAALEATGGGTANSVERDGENGATWEVEVTKSDGTTVDVRLDAAYAVVVIEGDHEDTGTSGD
jgi:uncharacterized membrane protein YkoI